MPQLLILNVGLWFAHVVFDRSSIALGYFGSDTRHWLGQHNGIISLSFRRAAALRRLGAEIFVLMALLGASIGLILEGLSKA